MVGYNHKLRILLETVIEKIANFKVNSDRFSVIKVLVDSYSLVCGFHQMLPCFLLLIPFPTFFCIIIKLVIFFLHSSKGYMTIEVSEMAFKKNRIFFLSVYYMKYLCVYGMFVNKSKPYRERYLYIT